MNIDLRDTFICSRATVKEMIKQGGGKIIKVASIIAFISTANMSAYCTSKGGMIQPAKVMTLEFVKYNIQINAICPSYFLTPLNRKLFESDTGKRIIQKNISMGRVGSAKN
jgi:NAD(P)-dependent dehydrogenase (short-subunit alcohol dehydrogenase family)